MTLQLDSSLTVVGVVMGIATGLGFASAMIATRLSARLKPSWVVSGALVAVGLALVGFSVPASLFAVVLAAIVFALGDGLLAVLQSAYAARGTPDSVRAGLVAVNGTTRNAGKFVGPLVVGAIASWAGIAVGLAVAGVTVIIAAILLPHGLSALDHVLRGTEASVEDQ